MRDIGETIIDCRNCNVRIIVNEAIISNDLLDWKDIDNYCLELTLNEIAQQVNTPGTIYVWEESGLEGRIYLFNNQGDRKWHKHGKTRGFA